MSVTIGNDFSWYLPCQLGLLVVETQEDEDINAYCTVVRITTTNAKLINSIDVNI